MKLKNYNLEWLFKPPAYQGLQSSRQLNVHLRYESSKMEIIKLKYVILHFKCQFLFMRPQAHWPSKKTLIFISVPYLGDYKLKFS